MPSFGLELEICNWQSPHDLIPWDGPSAQAPSEVEYLEGEENSQSCNLLRRPVAVYNEVPHIANFRLLDPPMWSSPSMVFVPQNQPPKPLTYSPPLPLCVPVDGANSQLCPPTTSVVLSPSPVVAPLPLPSSVRPVSTFLKQSLNPQ